MVLSVQAQMIYTLLCFLVDGKNQTQGFSWIL